MVFIHTLSLSLNVVHSSLRILKTTIKQTYNFTTIHLYIVYVLSQLKIVGSDSIFYGFLERDSNILNYNV